MGTWLNVAFIQCADTTQVERELSRMLVEGGRRLTTPKPRTPERYDRMQYGLGDEVHRWGVAGFHGAPGWTVLRTAPFELLMQGTPPLLARLAESVGAPAFQYNIHDSSSGFLMEVDAAGRVELSGYVAHDPTQYWNGAPPMDRVHARFYIIDPSDVAAWSESAMPEARVRGMLSASEREHLSTGFKTYLEAREAELMRWLGEVGAEIGPDPTTNAFRVWKVHPAHVIRRLAHVGSDFLDADWCVEPTIKTVFGGSNSEHCDNLFLVQTLVPHAPMPVDGFVLYAEAST